jgi:hypothetical protein
MAIARCHPDRGHADPTLVCHGDVFGGRQVEAPRQPSAALPEKVEPKPKPAKPIAQPRPAPVKAPVAKPTSPEGV